MLIKRNNLNKHIPSGIVVSEVFISYLRLISVNNGITMENSLTISIQVEGRFMTK